MDSGTDQVGVDDHRDHRVLKEDLKTPADPLDLGAGRIDLTKAGDPGLTFDVVARDFLDAGMNQEADINLNTPSIYVPKLAGTITTTRTATNVTDQRVRYRASATAPDKATITVTPELHPATRVNR